MMRFRISLELSIERDPEPEPPAFEHRDNDGTLIIRQDQARYIGFQPEDTA